MTKAVQLHEAQNNLYNLLRLVDKGTEILLMDDDTPMGRIVSAKSGLSPRVPGLNQGKAEMSEDFDEPLADDFWTGVL